VPKFIHFHPVINFLGKCAFLDLADFWLIFPFFERIEVCAFISRKLNKLRGPFFTFRDNFTPSVLIAKKSHLGVKVRGLQRPQIGLRNQNFKIDTFSRDSCEQTVRPRGSMVVLFCTPEGPVVNALTRFQATPTILAQTLRGASPPKKLHPIFAKFSGVGAKFLHSLYGDPKARQGKKLATVPWPTSRKLNFKISRKIDFYSSCGKSVVVKTLTVCAGVPL